MKDCFYANAPRNDVTRKLFPSSQAKRHNIKAAQIHRELPGMIKS